MSFRASQLGFEYGLNGVSFDVPSSGLIAVVGPNGAGKSTLVGILAGLRSPYRGSCLFRDREVKKWPRHEFARHVAFLPQALKLEFPFTAEQVVFMGRTPYASGWFESPEDRAAVDRAMTITDTLEYRQRDCRSLSGGERQRVILASALAQEPEALILDEPTTFLDLKHQISMYRLLANLAAKGMLVIAVTHDLNLALQHADQVIALNHGEIVAAGATHNVLTESLMANVFGVRVALHPGTEGRAWMEPLSEI